MSESITVGEVMELPADDPRAVAFRAMLGRRAESARSGPFLTSEQMRSRLADPARFADLERSLASPQSPSEGGA